MSEKLVLRIRANEGYASNQVRSRMTVGELRSILEDYEADVEIVTLDLNNSYGADWGVVIDTDTEYDDDEEEN